MTWVFLPGMDGTGDLLAPVVKELSRDGDVCVVARYPKTRVCDRAELYSIARVVVPDFEDYILVAESFSGPFAIELAARKPPRMRGLVIATTFPRPPVRGMGKLIVRLLGPVAIMLPLPAFVIRSLLTGADSTEEQVEFVRSTIQSVKTSALASRLAMTLRNDRAALLPHVKVPTLVIGASRDRLIPRGVTEQLRNGIVGAFGMARRAASGIVRQTATSSRSDAKICRRSSTSVSVFKRAALSRLLRFPRRSILHRGPGICR
jgi:pimeloyl-[acyl-carrier protein] methyl ester esterase